MRRGTLQHLLRLAWIALATLVAATPANSRACRYSVRDTGFVDLDQPPWRLRLHHFPETQRALWVQAAGSRLLDSNIRLDPTPAPGPQSSPATPALTLVGPDDRVLELAGGTALPADSAAIAEFLDRLALSSTRDELHDQLLRSFAVIVLVEGTDAARNTTARRSAEEAIRAFVPLLPSLPKPVEFPPRLLAIPAANLPTERVLVWSLGLAPVPVDEPRVAVLYGRGRRLGPPLGGPEITRTSLAERLTLIGQDCECDLERSWLQGPVYPARWDATRQTAAARLLGFDPENPLVRTEVTRIVLRGPAAGQGRRAASSAFDTLALGYREESVDAPESETEAPLADPIPSPPTTPGAPGADPGPASSSSSFPSDSGSTAAAPAGKATELWLGLGGLGLAALLAGGFLALKAIRAR
jgi:hypothetical protein